MFLYTDTCVQVNIDGCVQYYPSIALKHRYMVPAEVNVSALQTLFVLYFLLVITSASRQHFGTPIINFISRGGNI